MKISRITGNNSLNMYSWNRKSETQRCFTGLIGWSARRKFSLYKHHHERSRPRNDCVPFFCSHHFEFHANRQSSGNYRLVSQVKHAKSLGYWVKESMPICLGIQHIEKCWYSSKRFEPLSLSELFFHGVYLSCVFLRRRLCESATVAAKL